jgi:hypothetical protein
VHAEGPSDRHGCCPQSFLFQPNAGVEERPAGEERGGQRAHRPAAGSVLVFGLADQTREAIHLGQHGELLRHRRGLVLGVNVQRVGRMVVGQRLTSRDGLLQFLGVLLACHHGAEVDDLGSEVAANVLDELVGDRWSRRDSAGSPCLDLLLGHGHHCQLSVSILHPCLARAKLRKQTAGPLVVRWVHPQHALEQALGLFPALEPPQTQPVALHAAPEGLVVDAAQASTPSKSSPRDSSPMRTPTS